MTKEGERGGGGMIDAGVRVHAGGDIYGPCSGLAYCGLGGNRTKLQGPKRVLTNGSKCSLIQSHRGSPVGNTGKYLDSRKGFQSREQNSNDNLIKQK